MDGQVVEHRSGLVRTVHVVFGKAFELIQHNARIQFHGFLNGHWIVVAAEGLVTHFWHSGITDPVVLCNRVKLDVDVVASEFVFGSVHSVSGNGCAEDFFLVFNLACGQFCFFCCHTFQVHIFCFVQLTHICIHLCLCIFLFVVAQQLLHFGQDLFHLYRTTTLALTQCCESRLCCLLFKCT